jgi:hypothetical protein
MRTSWRVVIGVMAFLSGLLQAQQPTNTADHAITQNGSQPVDEAQLAWRKALVEKKVPTKGCFKVVYPSQEWVSISCAPLPASLKQLSIPPKLRILKRSAPIPAPEPPADAGNGVDFVAETTEGTIVSATGSFSSVNTTGEINVASDGKTTSRNNQFALQINSNKFNAAACIGSTTGQCQGWEQFVLSNDPGSPPGVLWIQSWLLDYGTSCPQGWELSGSGPDCMYNGQAASPPIIGSVQNLKYVWMEGVTSAEGKDTVFLGWTDGVTQAMAYSQDSMLDLAAHWTQSEFNVFGDLTWHQARFDPNTSIVVYQALTFANDAAARPLSAIMGGTTGETNNLDLVNPPCVQGPLLSFMESNAPNAGYACPKPLNLCAASQKQVAYDRVQLAKLESERTGPTCKGPALFECTQAIRAEQNALTADAAIEKKNCAP